MYKRYLVILIYSIIPVIAYNQSRTLTSIWKQVFHNSPLL